MALFRGYGVAQVRKAIGVALAGGALWAGQVVASTPAHISAAEWLGAGGVGLAVAACFGLTNEPVREKVIPESAKAIPSAKP